MNEGIQIAQRGALVVHDPWSRRCRRLRATCSSRRTAATDYYALRFMGFFIRDPETGAVVGQFPHLFPASIAIGYGIDGLTGARRTVGVWAILGLLAVYFAGARLVGRTAAAAAAALLALHVIEVWFAQYPNAEVVMQALLFAALLANARAHVDGDRFFAPVAALLLGLLLFLRFDAVLGIAGVAGGLALRRFSGRRPPRWSFLAALRRGRALRPLYLLGPMRAYAASADRVLSATCRGGQYAALAAARRLGAVLALCIAAPRRRPQRIVRWAPWRSSVRCLAARALRTGLPAPAGKLAAHDANALRTFTNLYLTLPALLAALIGFALVVRGALLARPRASSSRSRCSPASSSSRSGSCPITSG